VSEKDIIVLTIPPDLDELCAYLEQIAGFTDAEWEKETKEHLVRIRAFKRPGYIKAQSGLVFEALRQQFSNRPMNIENLLGFLKAYEQGYDDLKYDGDFTGLYAAIIAVLIRASDALGPEKAKGMLQPPGLRESLNAIMQLPDGTAWIAAAAEELYLTGEDGRNAARGENMGAFYGRQHRSFWKYNAAFRLYRYLTETAPEAANKTARKRCDERMAVIGEAMGIQFEDALDWRAATAERNLIARIRVEKGDEAARARLNHVIDTKMLFPESYRAYLWGDADTPF
jgi:hypothetical protein